MDDRMDKLGREDFGKDFGEFDMDMFGDCVPQMKREDFYFLGGVITNNSKINFQFPTKPNKDYNLTLICINTS